MVSLVLAFLAGVMLIQQLPVLPAPPWLLLMLLIVAVLFQRRYWLIGFFVLGMLWASVFAMHRLADRLTEAAEGIDLAVTGEVSNLPEHDAKVSRFDFLINESTTPLPGKIRLSWYYPEQVVKTGQHWAFTVKLKRPHGTYNSAGFDYERWLFQQGIGAVGYIRAQPAPLLLKPAVLCCSLLAWRQQLAEQMTKLLSHAKHPALLKALTLGDGSDISHRQWQVFRNTGTTHLVVISGSHIALIAGLVYLLLLKLWAYTGILTWSPQQPAALVAMLFGAIYAGLAGFSVPTQRAVIMLLVTMSAILLQRHGKPLHVLMLALLGVLVLEPIAVLAAGFWLSFGAVALILYVSSGRLGEQGIIHNALKINCLTSLGLAPLLLWFFQQVSLIAPIANLIAVPVISFVTVPVALLAVIAMLVSPALASPLFYLADMSLQGLWWLLAEMADWPLASINHAAPPLWALLFVLPGLMLLLAPAGVPCRWLSVVLLLPVMFNQARLPAPGNFSLSLLDVGQGLAVVLQTARHCLVFDTGGKFSADSDMGQSVVVPFLRSQGLNTIDTLFISHGDNDHIGGAQSVLSEIKVGQVLSSVPQQLLPFSAQACQAGQHWSWDDVEFSVLSPALPFNADNDNSCVLKIHSKQAAVLLTGDIEATAEQWLVNHYGKQLAAQVLIAPHHGSKTSSTWAFLQAVQPEVVLIPSGYRNQFGHPHQEVLARYQQMRLQVLNSADSGAILVDMQNSAIDVQALRATTGKYWNNKPDE